MKLIDIKKENGFRIDCKSQTTAEITIYSVIGDSMWGDSVSAKSFSDQLGSLPKTVNQINLRMNSGGGDVFDGVSIYNRLKQHKAKVTAYVDGLAASIASVIILAADEVVMGEGSLIMIHKPWTMTMGNSQDLEETIDRLNDVEEQILGIYQRNTRLDRSELRKMVAEETWLDADQALEYGFAQRKMAGEESIDMAACVNGATWIKNKPELASRHKLVNNKIKEFGNEIKDFLARD